MGKQREKASMESHDAGPSERLSPAEFELIYTIDNPAQGSGNERHKSFQRRPEANRAGPRRGR